MTVTTRSAEEPLPPQVTSVEGDGYHSDSDDSVFGVNDGSGLLQALADATEADLEEEAAEESWIDGISEAGNDAQDEADEWEDYSSDAESEQNDDTLTLDNPGFLQTPELPNDLAAAVSDLLLDLNPSQSIAAPSSPPMKYPISPRFRRPIIVASNIKKVPRANSWSSFNPHDNPEVASRMVPPMAFTLFQQFATEIRLKIWYWACQHPRVIEIERSVAIHRRAGPERGTHVAPLICTPSRKPPAVLSANVESREEALKVYKKRVLGCCCGGPDRDIYFNQEVDIVYFGEATCWSTVTKVFHQTTYMGGEIHRVALDVMKKCDTADCTHDFQLRDVHVNTMSGMEILHGSANEFLGCPGLKEVFFIIKSEHADLKQGQVDASFELHPATSSGLTDRDRLWKNTLEVEVENLETFGTISGVQGYKWKEEAPNFHFVNFHPVAGRDMRVRSSVSVKDYEIAELENRNWAFLKRLEIRTSCKIAIPDMSFPSKQHVEIKLFGTKRSIERAKQAIVEKTHEDWQKWCKERTTQRSQRDANAEVVVEETIEQ